MKDYQPVMDAKQKADHAYLDYVQSLRDAHKETKH
jgi:hypothetical protein